MNKKTALITMLAFLAGVVAALLLVRGCAPKAPPTTPVKIRYEHKARQTLSAKTAQSMQARMAIIIDDWGNNQSLLESVQALGRPMTLAVIPRLRKSRAIAQEASERGFDVIIHMPMQPIKCNEPLEPHTIMTDSTDRQVHEYLNEAFGEVPGAQGLNNHMGSKATQDPRIMRLVLQWLKSRGLFFVDSQVTRLSVGPQVARQIGVPQTRRDVFIDNVLENDTIRQQLNKAAKLALKKGRAVVIGHAHRKTLEVIAEMIPNLEAQGIQLVDVKEMLES